MAQEPQIGAIVQTRDFGLAEVRRILQQRYIVALQEMGGLEIELGPAELLLPAVPDLASVPEAEPELEPIPEPALEPAPEQEPEQAETPALPERARIVVVRDRNLASFPQRKAVEALRFGLVPSHSIESLTLGFPVLKDWVLSRFPDANDGLPQVSEIVGPFGTGKSHAMAVVRYLAQEAEYLHARVEVDGQTISLSDPLRLLYSLWSTLSGRGYESQTPVLDLFVRSIETGSPAPQIMPSNYRRDQIHEYYQVIKALLHYNRLDRHRELLEAALSCSTEFTVTEVRKRLSEDLRLRTGALQPMIGTRSSRSTDFVIVLAGMAQLAKLAGYKGLVVTIDEFEVEHNTTPAKLRAIQEIMKFLASYLSGEMGVIPAPLSIFFATVGDDGHKGNALVDMLIDAAGGDYFVLDSIKTSQLWELARRIHRIYEEAYGLGAEFDSSLVEQTAQELEDEGYTESGLIRGFIKLYVSKLDSLYGPPVLQ